jgi:hypothetical protein
VRSKVIMTTLLIILIVLAIFAIEVGVGILIRR